MTDDLIRLARQYHVPAGAHYANCEADHLFCLLLRMADEIERLRTQLAGADLLLRVARDCLHATPTSPWAAETTNRIDAFLAREEKP